MSWDPRRISICGIDEVTASAHVFIKYCPTGGFVAGSSKCVTSQNQWVYLQVTGSNLQSLIDHIDFLLLSCTTAMALYLRSCERRIYPSRVMNRFSMPESILDRFSTALYDIFNYLFLPMQHFMSAQFGSPVKWAPCALSFSIRRHSAQLLHRALKNGTRR